jgi:hypothetical protein
MNRRSSNVDTLVLILLGNTPTSIVFRAHAFEWPALPFDIAIVVGSLVCDDAPLGFDGAEVVADRRRTEPEGFFFVITCESGDRCCGNQHQA